MRHALPTLICSLLLAACGSHTGSSDSNAAASAPATPATTVSAPATPAANGSATAPAASTPASAQSSATADNPAASDSASGDDTASTLSAAELAQANKVYQQGQGKWVEGTNYFDITPNQPKVSDTGKAEVVEVFSWGCPACNAAHPAVDSMRKALPSFATMVYLPAAFRPDENWVVYQRTFFTAQALGMARKSYDAMFDATWKSGELATYNLAGRGLKDRSDWPKIEDFAKFFAKHYGADAKQFVAIANSFSINTKMKRADELIKSYGVGGTPTFVVSGMYRFDFRSAGGVAQATSLAQWLAAKAVLGK